MHKVLICIAGGSCSGKTYNSKLLKRKFGELASVVLLDNYYKDEDEVLEDENGKNFDIPDSYHINEFKYHISELLNDSGIEMPIYDFKNNRRRNGQVIYIEPKEIIIVEGLFIISILKFLNTLKIYVEASEDTRLDRRIKRDTEMYQVSEYEVIKNFKNKILPYHKEFVEPQKELADIIISGESNE